jgi:hypothetical protein
MTILLSARLFSAVQYDDTRIPHDYASDSETHVSARILHYNSKEIKMYRISVK